MISKRFLLFKLFGFKVYVDLSWFFIAVFIAWSLAVGYFPAMYPGLAASSYFLMGLLGMLILFLCIVLHEVGHAIVARYYKIPINSITLFIFGGVAEMSDEPPSAIAEFNVAIAGPLVSLLLAGSLYWLAAVGQSYDISLAVLGTLLYLAAINTILVVFNLIPAFPLDGGRVMRAILWKFKGSLRSATRISSKIGQGFGLLLVVLGFLGFLTGNFVAGVWWVLIGLFLQNAASMSYKQLLLRKQFEGEVVERFMKESPVSVSPDLPIHALVDNYIYRYFDNLYPVTVDGELRGYITIDQLKEVPRSKWHETKVGDILVPLSDDITIEPDVDAVKALVSMNNTNRSELLVSHDRRLLGILRLSDLTRLFSLKMELDEKPA